jgi:hypothetical protein
VAEDTDTSINKAESERRSGMVYHLGKKAASFYLGKMPARPEATRFWYSEVFNRARLPEAPEVFGHIDNTTRVDILGNNMCGNCVWATQAHLTNILQTAGGHPAIPFTPRSVIGDYSQATGYNPDNPETDRGTDAQMAAEWWRTKGIHDGAGTLHQIQAYVGLKIGELDELLQAAYLFGGVGLGLRLPKSAEPQFVRGERWTVVPGSHIIGGHMVAVVGRNSNKDIIIATWDGLQAATPNFVETYMDEGYAYFSLEYLNEKGVSPEAYNRVKLEEIIGNIGKSGSIDTTPNPSQHTNVADLPDHPPPLDYHRGTGTLSWPELTETPGFRPGDKAKK